MRSKQVDRLYRELDGAERFRLALSAVADGDVEEAERILATSPRVVVRQHEPVVDAALRAGLGLGWTLGIQAAERIGSLDALALVEDWLQEGALAEDPRTEAVMRLVDRAGAVAAEGLASLLQAFTEICAEVPGLDPAVFVSAMPLPVSDGLERHAATIDEAEPDPEQVEVARASFQAVLAATGLEA